VEYEPQGFAGGSQVWVSSQYGLSVSIDLGLTERWYPGVNHLA
jgi:hypothetical protein